MPIPAEPVEEYRSPKRQEVYEQLRELIVRGELAPGTKLVDTELGRLTGASKGPVREALNRLATQWLVEIEPRRGTHVTYVDRRVGVAVVQVVTALLADAVRCATRDLTPQDDEALRHWRDEVLTLPDDELRATVTTRDDEDQLMAVFVRRSGNAVLTELAAELRPYLRRIAHVHAEQRDLEALRSSHVAIVDAALRRDAEAAVAAWTTQGEATVTRYLSLPVSPSVEDRERAPLMREHVTALIRDAILAGTLAPGEPLPEREMMRWLRTSRTPLRDALTQLEAQGLVVQPLNRTARVARMDAAAVADVVHVAGLLRGLGLRLLLERDPAAALAALEELVEPVLAAGDTSGVLEWGLRFSDWIDRSVPNPVLARVARNISARARWYVTGVPSAGSGVALRQVSALLDAVRAADVAASDRAVRALYDAMVPPGV